MKKAVSRMCDDTHNEEETHKKWCRKNNAKRKSSASKVMTIYVALRVFIMMTFIGLLAWAVFACSSTRRIDNTTVQNFELDNYLGHWYEIARYDHRFERDMTHCTTVYTLQNDGTIRVTNQGRKNGQWKRSEGKAKVTEENGLLRVSFFGPFYSDYRVMMLGPDYSYALVGSSSEDYLWILSRTPYLTLDNRDLIMKEISRRGYPIHKLIWVKQD